MGLRHRQRSESARRGTELIVHSFIASSSLSLSMLLDPEAWVRVEGEGLFSLENNFLNSSASESLSNTRARSYINTWCSL